MRYMSFTISVFNDPDWRNGQFHEVFTVAPVLTYTFGTKIWRELFSKNLQQMLPGLWPLQARNFELSQGGGEYTLRCIISGEKRITTF